MTTAEQIAQLPERLAAKFRNMSPEQLATIFSNQEVSK